MSDGGGVNCLTERGCPQPQACTCAGELHEFKRQPHWRGCCGRGQPRSDGNAMRLGLGIGVNSWLTDSMSFAGEFNALGLEALAGRSVSTTATEVCDSMGKGSLAL